MLRAVIAFCLRRRGSVVALACAFLVYGVFAVRRAPLDVLPDFAPPEVVVQTEAPGLSAEQVEMLVTTPLEAALAGTGDLEAIRSQSIQGLSVITAVFGEDTDVYRARQLLGEQLAQVALPSGVALPKLTPLSSATMDLLKVGLVSDTLSPMELRDLADWTIAPRLRAVSGVSSVTVMGGEVRQLQVQLDLERLAQADVSVDEVLEAARQASAVVGAGFVETAAQRVLVQTRGQALDPEAFGQTFVALRDGRPLRLADVARVTEGAALRFGDCLVQGRPGVLVKTLSQYGANTLEVTLAVERALAELQPTFDAAGVEVFPRIHRPANFIETSVGNLGHSLLVGAGLVALVLLLFLFDVRAALISMTAIPLSLLAAVVGLEKLGMSLNTMTMGGLAIAIGEVVDDAIIDVENIVRRLRENALLEAPRSAFRVVLDASLEVRRSVVYATFVVVLVFVPVLTLPGLQGRFFAPLGVAYILAVLASLFVALTLTPALGLLLLARRRHDRTEPRIASAMKRVYVALLTPVVERPVLAGAGAVLAGAAAVAALSGLRGEFLPEFREGHFVLQLSMAPGGSLPELSRIGRRVSERLLTNPHIATVEQQVGRAELSEDPWGTHRSEFHIELQRLEPDVEAGVADEIRAVLRGIPGIQYELLTFLEDRIGESISGETAPVVVNVFGEDLDLIDAGADRVSAVLAAVPGVLDLQRGSLPGMPSIEVDLDRARLLEHGLTPLRVMEVLRTAYQGEVVTQLHEGSRTLDAVALLAPGQRRDPELVSRLPLRSSTGALVTLGELADVHLTTGRFMLLREGGRRRQTVTCNVADGDISAFVAEARSRLESTVLPSGTYWELGGAAAEEHAARRDLLLHAGLATLGVLLLLAGAFHHWRNVLLVLVNLPFALVGGVLAVRFSGGALSMGSMVGFVTLFGITLRNSIMLTSHFEHLVSEEGQLLGRATIVRGARERLLPILMTALVTGLGLLPIALGSGSAGREIEGPMAIVILGGLGTSTLLNLLLLPALALRFGRFGLDQGAVAASGV